MKRVIISLLVAGLLVAGYFFFIKKEKAQNGEYKTTPVEKGDIVNTVSSTGELEPVSTVDVGTQVSGTLSRVYVDFNDKVKKGQLLAVIDTFVLASQLRDARASLEKAKASEELARIEFENQQRLRDKDMSSQYSLDKARTTHLSAQATLEQAQASLSRAKKNLSYALIKSPIDGIVIHREVESGQTVAASFSAPTLFIIAESLDRMRILANVDESDIGMIDTGMTARFEVPAYPDRKFEGRVTQIRMQPTVVSNVVNYTAVIEADNPGNVLLPGMTATVDFLLDEKKDVLMVSNTAFSFQPTMEMMQAMRKRMQRFREEGKTPPPPKSTNPKDIAMPDSMRAKVDSIRAASSKTEVPDSPPVGMGFGLRDGNRENMAMLWYRDEKGEFTAMPVEKGVTDGRNTEIKPLRGELPVGTEIITKAPKAEESSSTRRNPFMPGRPGR